MLVNLTDVLTSEGKRKEEQIALEMKEFICNGEHYPVCNEPQVAFTFTNTAKDKALIEGETTVVLKTPCSRCLQMVEVPLALKFAHEVTTPENIPDEEEDWTQFVEGYQLNVEDLMYYEIIINLPTKVLCKEDCKGICRVCGQNLNERECGCDTFVPDPRMAAIKDIFNAHKEV